MTMLDALPNHAGPPNTGQRRTIVVERNELPTPSGKHYGRCGYCNLFAASDTSGGVDGFFGAHQGTDGSEPSCPDLGHA